ncbi:unnamed protein product [Acanthoscelides obtectus]|uniref:Mitotic checkpoint serine/threonine-protein kinase BUB1 n=1 Tax=Acanthoscelides obtectus TaxID=200917 RepID=A0A9P0K479_ACAOB|nr:unnamed protein product [Acanthoscelides obtectus]CAK1676799.1 Mitotic checkpoint serine/threonine-protein kinase BUB1 [Acanthoscelides obtectus]
MDFDLSKENIQPLRGGRNVQQLGMALQAQTSREYQAELLHQQQEFENLIRTYEGEDPLENYYNYISWIEQSYPKRGHEGNLLPLLESCLQLFENDKRYTNDIRYCKLLIKYFDTLPNPIESYQMAKSKGLCVGCTDLYKAWAYYYEAVGDFQNANSIFEEGKRNLAQPYDELEIAHNNMIMAAGQHLLFGPDENRLQEKRHALTSLQPRHGGRVGMVRTAAFLSGPGAVTGGGGAVSRTNNNAACAVHVYEGAGPQQNEAAAAPASVIGAVRRQDAVKENELKPGPWTTVPVKKRVVGDKVGPAFTVHCDIPDNATTAGASACFSPSSGIRLPKNHPRACLEHYADFRVKISYPEPPNPAVVPMYPKDRVYALEDTEFSIEELRAERYPRGVQQAQQSLHEKQENTLSDLRNPFTSWGRSPTQSDELDIWSSPGITTPPKSSFQIFEQSLAEVQPKAPNKGSAMKTAFKDLNAEELAETGSRGGMDVAAIAHPTESASQQRNTDVDSPTTYTFNLNLNNMAVSTPQYKRTVTTGGQVEEAASGQVKKQLFAEPAKAGPLPVNKTADKEKALSTIIEETHTTYASSSSSSGATTKSSLYTNQTNKMNTISEEHNSYLQQNMMVNAALRSSLLGTIMDLGTSPAPEEIVPPPAPPAMPSPMQSSPFESPARQLPKPTLVSPIGYIPSDPFKSSLINQLLERVSFPGSHTDGYIELPCINKIVAKKEPVFIGQERYIVEKQLGKGTFGVVFKAFDLTNNRSVAIKYQRPANKWEYHICRELQARLADHPLRDRFMDVSIGYFSDQASILISEFMPGGSLLDLANLHKQRERKPMKECLVVYFCIQMLEMVQVMHDVKIIHADIKPDNFLVFILPNNTIGLQLIDFGCGIDMSLFPPDASFTRQVTTEDFVCCEMLDGRPWNYHTDLFCVAATAHVLLFDSYIRLRKQDGVWSIMQRFNRWMKVDLWNMFFSTLLNQQSGPADTSALRAMLDETLCILNKDSSTALPNQMRYIVNLLNNQ